MQDGASLWRLVQSTGTLELNSAYFYVLMATDFGRTCLLAHDHDQLVGAIVGYHPPTQPHTAFVWQIGVQPSHQGQGLGLRMLQAWLALPSNQHCQWVTATVADNNPASAALFHSLARAHHTTCVKAAHFTSALFPIEHPAEKLFRVGPLDRGTPVPV
jgi:L-2,4-diaminobutyric acid acetyltransferase